MAVETTAEASVGRSTPKDWMEVAVSNTAERRDVGVASWRREASEGSKPGGGSIKILCPCIFPFVFEFGGGRGVESVIEGYKAVIRDSIACWDAMTVSSP